VSAGFSFSEPSAWDFRHPSQNALEFSVGRNAPFARSSMAMEAGAAHTAPQRGGVKNTPDHHSRKKFFSIFRLDRVGQHAASLFRRM
jgi:hypothetical protein